MTDYLIDDKDLYKVIKKNKKYIELALLPIISHDHIQINDTIGKSEILTKIGYKNVEVKTLPITLKGKQNSVIQIAVRQKI